MSLYKGFTSLPAIFGVVLLSIGIAIGVIFQKPLTSVVKDPVDATDLESTVSASITPVLSPTPSPIPSVSNTPSQTQTQSQSVTYTDLSYNFDVKPGAVEVIVKAPDGGFKGDVLVELRTQNEVNVFLNKTRPQTLNYVSKENPKTEFTEIVPGAYKISAMYGSLWHQYGEVTVVSDKKAVVEITIQP